MNIFINKAVWNKFTPEEMEQFKEEVFRYYRENGFPYFKLTQDEKDKVWKKLKDFDTKKILLPNFELNQDMLGLNLCNNYFPNIWSAKSGNFMSPMETFENDEKFKIAIAKRIKLDDCITDAGIRKILSFSHGSQRVSNFRPTVAKYIYDDFCGDGDVLDFSCGYGGRLFGFLASKKTKLYVGCEPNSETFKYLGDVVSDFNELKTVQIHRLPFEDFETEHKFDLVFSSPPYFNTEKYSKESTQSYMRYPTKEEWKNGFLKPLIRKSYEFMKPDGYFCINIANVNNYKNLEEDTLELCYQQGFVLYFTLKMRLSALMGKHFKYEPIFCFKKS
jgi:SAM-dependent methyltransferase